MPNPQEIDQETREALARLGFSDDAQEGVAFTNRGHKGAALWLWSPGEFAHNPDQWLADKGYNLEDLEAGAGQLFEDPISAAVWLNVEASHG